MKKNNNSDMISKIDAKLDQIQNKIGSIDVTLARNTKDLEIHMMRTEQNEGMIKSLRDDLVPVKKHVLMVEAGLKVLGLIALCVTIVSGILRIFS